MSGPKDSGHEKTFLDAILGITNALASASVEADYVFRGETGIYDRVSSGLYRDMEGRIPGSLEIEVLQHRNLEEARKYTHETDEMTILTELQHYGAKTNLIDFTEDYLIALREFLRVCTETWRDGFRAHWRSKSSSIGTWKRQENTLTKRMR